jgi:NADP-dependent 3-hydroxy acid dehydrogenase YdfG
MNSLKDRKVVVTGATSGIGLALVKALHAAGAKLLAHGRTAEKVDALRASASGIGTFAADVREPDFAKRLVASAVEQIGGCDVLVNNAGIVWAGPAERATPEKISEMVAVNIDSPFKVAHEAIAHFKKQNSGHLINVTSIVGLKARIYSGIYSGTKHAMEALSDSLRQELARTQIQVSCIEPGMTLTGLHRDFKEHPMKTMQVETPLSAEDIADAIIFTMTRPSHVTIANLVILPKDQKT